MKKNNWLALLLAVVMAASALPLSAFAEEGREMDLVQNFEVLDPVFPQEEEVDQVPAQEEANSASSQEEEADEAPAPGGAEEGTPVQGEEPEETPEQEGETGEVPALGEEGEEAPAQEGDALPAPEKDIQEVPAQEGRVEEPMEVQEAPVQENLLSQEGETGSLAGTGSQEDPFRIASLEDLKLFRDQVNGGNTGKGEYYALTGNIDLKGEPWIPIAAGGGTFAGVFDGNGHIISNLVIEDPSLDGAGLFGTLASPGTIRNLTVENVSITAQSQAGGLVGHAFTGILENCTVRGWVQITAHYKVGGLTGGGYAAIQNCHLSASSGSRVTGLYKEPDLEGDNVGGLIGYRGEGACPITGSTVSGLAVTGTRKVGGLVGSAFTNNQISGCAVQGLQVTSAATPDYIAANGSTISLGGLVGNYTANGSGDGFLRDCTVTDLTLASVNPGVYMSYIAGGIRGNLPSLPASPWVQSGNRIAGSCTGANVSAAAAEGIYYPSLALAVEAVVNSSGKSGTVTLLNGAQGGGIGLFNGKGAKGVDLTIDFGGNTYTCVDPAVGSAGTESQGFHLEAGNKVTLKNGTIQVAEESTKTVMLIQNYCDLTLQNLTLVGADKTEYILSCNYGDISLERVNIFGAHSGLVGIDLMHWIGSYPLAPSMTIKNTSENLIEGSIEVYCYQSGVGVIEDCREPAVLTILGGRFSADPTAYLPEGYQVTGSGPYLVSRVPAPAPTPDQSKDERPSAPAVTPAVTPAATPLPDSQAAQPPVGQQRPAPTATPAPTQSEPAQVTTVAQAQVTEKTAVVTLEKEAFTQVVNQAVTQGKANGASPLVTVEVAQDQEAQAVQVTLPAQALETLSQQEGAALTFTSQVAQVTFDAPALAAIARQAEEEVRLVVAPVAQDQMTPAQVQAAGDYPTFELTLHSGEAVISSFEEGNATVTLPYTLAQGQEAQGIVVWYLDQEGTLTPCQTSYDPEAGQVTFVTPHFSRYVIGYDESLLSRADLNLPVQEEAPAEASEATFPLPLVAAVAALVAAAMVLLGRKFLLRED